MIRRRALRSRVVLAAACICAGMAACSGGGDSASTVSTTAAITTVAGSGALADDRPVSGSIEVYDQSSDGTTLTIERATINGAAGWVVVHVDEGGPGDVIGCAPIPEGSTTNLTVPLARKVSTGRYWPMLHRDAGQLGVCEWPGGPDGPVRPAGGAITYATRKITLTVP